MHTKLVWWAILLLASISVYAQETDSITSVTLKNVTVTGNSFRQTSRLSAAVPVDVAEKEFLSAHFTGNLVQALEYIPGVRAMDIGAGFSKPMIRGMAFNRISVTENGIKQEGQQWGSDHGLEIDAFNIERVTIRKGPSSLLYGSDAMGGVVEITPLPPPVDDQLFGAFALLGKSMNGNIGASLMVGVKKGAWYTKVRYSEQRFGDYRIPADTIVYLTQKMPVYHRRLKNTAGIERDVNLFTAYRKGKYASDYMISNAYQKVGFFPGAHGIPDASRVQDDGDSRNVGLPYSTVNHFKVTTHQQYMAGRWIASWDAGYQTNHREEWSLFHTHYGTQPLPEKDPDKELKFSLDTYSSSVRFRTAGDEVWEYHAGWDVQYQQNRIGGYSFLLPRYNRFTTGLFGWGNWKPSSTLTVSGGLRYDYGRVDVSAYTDPYLETYLQGMGYDETLISQYRWRSYRVKRGFSDLSGMLGVVWSVHPSHLLKANIGHSFRLPGANELAANGVHHGTFRHEQGDSALDSEKGWQVDVSYQYEDKTVTVSATPFVSWYSNYIFLSPTGEWSVLPHAGLIYRYAGAETMFMGVEASVDVRVCPQWTYGLSGEYLYTSNRDEHTALSFSPPASMRNMLTWHKKNLRLYAGLHTIASQRRVAKNESRTPGATLLNMGGSLHIPIAGSDVEVGLSMHNLLNKKYYNHLSFYRKVEIPEPGRNFQLTIKVPFKILLK